MAEENNRYRFEENLEKENLKNEKCEESQNTDKMNQAEQEENLENSDNFDKNEAKFDKKTKIKKMYEKIDSLEEKVKQLEEENKQLKNANLMIKADEVNFKNRLEQDKQNTLKYANQKLLEKLVGELDLFDKVISMPTNDPTLKNYLIGFEMINNNFKNILSEEGVKKIQVKVGEQFDPKYHHVLQTGWDEQYEENAILGELRGGYTYKDRVLCTTLVKVNKKESE